MEAIDLGLSVLWADRNFGAQDPDDFGCYVKWHRKRDNLIALKEYEGDWIRIPSGWRLPTAEECIELIKECKIEQGYHTKAVVRGTTGLSITFRYGAYYSERWKVVPKPANSCGLYLTSSFGWNGNIKFLYLGFDYGRYQHYVENNGDRNGYLNIRLVKDRDKL